MSTLSIHAAPVSQAQPARSPIWWFALGVLVVAQLLAFWLLCSHQVRKAEARSTEVQVRQMALSDCLQYIPGSTIASCGNQIDTARVSTQQAQGQAVTGAMPVNFSAR